MGLIRILFLLVLVIGQITFAPKSYAYQLSSPSSQPKSSAEAPWLRSVARCRRRSEGFPKTHPKRHLELEELEPEKLHPEKLEPEKVEVETLKPEEIVPEDCSICLDRMAKPEIEEWAGCQHKFHKDCIGGWRKTMGEEASCPLCRNEDRKPELPAESSDARSPPSIDQVPGDGYCFNCRCTVRIRSGRTLPYCPKCRRRLNEI